MAPTSDVGTPPNAQSLSVNVELSFADDDDKGSVEETRNPAVVSYSCLAALASARAFNTTGSIKRWRKLKEHEMKGIEDDVQWLGGEVICG